MNPLLFLRCQDCSKKINSSTSFLILQFTTVPRWGPVVFFMYQKKKGD